MSDASLPRQLEGKRGHDHSSWLEPKRRFYACLLVFLAFCVLQHWSWMFSLGAFAAIALHAAIALYTGDIYVRTISLTSADAIYHRQDSAYSVTLVIHTAILLVFLGTLLLRILGL
jgi:hypothetical protein